MQLLLSSPAILLLLTWGPIIACQSLPPPSAPLPLASRTAVTFPAVGYSFARPLQGSDGVYYSSKYPFLARFENWIPGPWVRLIKEAGFRRGSPVSQPLAKKSAPASRPRIVSRRPIIVLPRTLPRDQRNAQPMKQQCTCEPKARYSEKQLFSSSVSSKRKHLPPEVLHTEQQLDSDYDESLERDYDYEANEQEDFQSVTVKPDPYI